MSLVSRRILRYEHVVQAGKLLVIVEGMPEELEIVRRVMGEDRAQDISTNAPQAAT
jgi:hypothetical protein